MTKCYDITPDVTPAPWFNNHENLYKLAQWLREERGWEFCKQNLLDVLETPWSWEKEWRLAAGLVDFVEYRPENNPDNPHPIDAAKCDWCGESIGYITVPPVTLFTGKAIHQVIEWLPVFEDTQSGEVACTDCRDSVATAVTA